MREDGTVWAWGHNGVGQLGDGTTTPRLQPVQVQGLIGVIEIAAGGAASLALQQDGTVRVSGRNTYGQLGDGKLGDGTTVDRRLPVQVQGLTTGTSVAAGRSHSLAVVQGGAARSWGDNVFGQLGLDPLLWLPRALPFP